MPRLVECIPNFSEGRRAEVLKAIVDEIVSVPGVQLLDKEMDASHNRSVVTFIGEPEAVKKAAFAAIKKASELIDMDVHKGEHPRMGATDVVPFVPISDVTMEECIQLAKELGKDVGTELGIPVYLYEKAATRPDRENLAVVRKGEYEGIKIEIEKNPDRKPDFGPSKLGKAGAVAIGARMPLVAFNVNLGTSNVSIAKKIANVLRDASGGFRYIKALGFEIKDRNIVQVSMNVVDYKQSTIFRAFEMVKREAERYGVPVIGSEIVGLVPEDALFDTADYYLRLENFQKEQILERKLRTEAKKQEIIPTEFISAVASASPAPGGGSVSALAGTLASALTSMVCHLTISKKKYADVKNEMEETLSKAEKIREELTALIKKDADAFDEVIASYKLPKRTAEEEKHKNEVSQSALKKASLVPLEVAQKSKEVLSLAKIVAEKGNVNSISDAGVAVYMAIASVRGAGLNVKINLKSIEDKDFVESTEKKILEIEESATKLADEIIKIVNEKIRL